MSIIKPVTVRVIIDKVDGLETEILFDRVDRITIDASGMIIDGKYHVVRPTREEVMSTPVQEEQVWDKPMRGGA